MDHAPDDIEGFDEPLTRPESGRVPVRLVGPRAARRSARPLLAGIAVDEHGLWSELPPGPAICVDARRLVHLSPNGVSALSAALAHGAAAAVPSNNAAPWPMCGLEPPRGAARASALQQHAEAIASLSDEPLGPEVPADVALPAVVGVRDASLLTHRPERLADLGVPPEQVVLVRSAWCHHRELPLVTMTMIVKNEAERIERAIELGRLLADEVVVYDTGSTDDTVARARAAGAVVRHGFWDDDFSRARNEAIRMVRGDWVLILDADDELVVGPDGAASFRRWLGTLADHHAVVVRVANLANAVMGGTTAGTQSRRIFQRNLRYRYRVHEVPVLPDMTEPDDVPVSTVWVRHTGYLGDQTPRIERNLRIAQQRIDDAPDRGERAAALFEYARGLMKAGRIEEAEAVYAESIGTAQSDEVRDLATLLLASMVAERDGRERVEPMCRPLLSTGRPSADAARWVLATVVTSEEAIDLLAGVHSVDFMLITASAAEVASARAFLCATLGRTDDVVAILESVESAHEQRFAWLAAAMAVEEHVLEPASRLVDSIAANGLGPAIAALAEGPPVGAHVIAVALWDRFPGASPLVAYLASGSPRAGFFAAMEARSLLAERDLLFSDPLEHLLDHPWGDEADRLLAALVLDDLEGGRAGRAASVAAQVTPELVGPVLDAVERVLPSHVRAAETALGFTVTPVP